MGDNCVQEPLLTERIDAVPTENKNGDPKIRRLRRSRSAPLGECLPGELNGVDYSSTNPEPRSMFGRLHSRIRKLVIFLFLYLATGTICFYLVRDQIGGGKTNAFIDSVYFTIVTMTSVGYNDILPNSATTKLLACVYVFSGMALLCLVLVKASDYLVEKQEHLLVSALQMSRSQTDILNSFDKNRIKNKCILVSILLATLILTGTIFLVRVENLSVIDAFFCVCATITSLGYTKKSFSSAGGRVFAIFWIFTSVVCLGHLFFCIAELNAEHKQKKLVKKFLAKRMTSRDLEAADLDDDGRVTAAEFIVYKLKEIGKIRQEDVSLAMKEFEILDYDQSGTLSAADLMLSQSQSSAMIK